MTYRIHFNKPYIVGSELDYIKDAVDRGHLSGNGYYTKKCQQFFTDKYGFKKCLLTHSGTAALEMAALLLNIQAGDEVILPSYTLVSTANAFILRGAKLRFADSEADHPNISVNEIQRLISERTKAIVVVHYAGHAVDLDPILKLCNEKGIVLIEDAAHAIDSTYKGKWLGGIGHLSAFSFHETKNISSGEGGMLVINDKKFEKGAEIIWEKGTNRTAFFRGEVDKYGWVDIGSSFLPSDIIAAVLWAQLEALDDIQNRRKEIWKTYSTGLSKTANTFRLPVIPEYATNNAHMFYLIFENEKERTKVIETLKAKNVHAVFHYQTLDKSSYIKDSEATRNRLYSPSNLESDIYSNNLVRLPFYIGLNDLKLNTICELIIYG